jgi:hypothetical protein
MAVYGGKIFSDSCTVPVIQDCAVLGDVNCYTFERCPDSVQSCLTGGCNPLTSRAFPLGARYQLTSL